MASVPAQITVVQEHISLDTNKEQILQQAHATLPKLLKRLYPLGTRYAIESKSEFGEYGCTNLLFHVKPIGIATEKQFLLRIYGSSVVDREREMRYVLELQRHRIGPVIFGIFDNGRIEEFYADAVVIDPLRGSSKLDQIAVALADFHKVIPQNQETFPNIGNEGIWSTIDVLYAKAHQFTLTDFNGDRVRYEKYQRLDWPQITARLQWLRKWILPSGADAAENAYHVMRVHYGANVHSLMQKSDLKMEFMARQFLYERVLCHNDVYVGNILELTQRNQVILIDFEYTSYNYRAHDFATFFGRCERNAFRPSDVPDAVERRQFIEYYLLQFADRFDKQRFSASEWSALLHACDVVTLEFGMINAYMWGLWAVNQTVFAKLTTVEYIVYAKQRLHAQFEYFKKLWMQQYPSRFVACSLHGSSKL